MSSNFSWRMFVSTALAGTLLGCMIMSASAQDAAPLAPPPLPAAEAAPAPAAAPVVPSTPPSTPEGITSVITEAPDTATVSSAQTSAPTASEPTAEEVMQAPALFDVATLWKGSLAYTEQQINDILAVREAFLLKRGGSGTEETADDGSDVNKILEGLAIEEEAPQIVISDLLMRLTSIVYYSPTDWRIYLGGRGYSRKVAMKGFKLGGSEDFKVVGVSKSQATFEWTPTEDTFKLLQQRVDANKKHKGPPVTPQVVKEQRISINEEKKTVRFTLRPNQTFSSSLMAVLEGQLTGATVAAINAVQAATSAYYSPAAPAAVEGAQEGAPAAQMPLTSDQRLRQMSDNLSQQYLDAGKMLGVQPAGMPPATGMPPAASPPPAMMPSPGAVAGPQSADSTAEPVMPAGPDTPNQP